MGMFDNVHCEVPLPDGYVGEFQTKDFDCFLSTILIRADGRLMIEDCDWEEVPLEERPNSNFPMLGATRAINKRWRDLSSMVTSGSTDRGSSAIGMNTSHGSSTEL